MNGVSQPKGRARYEKEWSVHSYQGGARPHGKNGLVTQRKGGVNNRRKQNIRQMRGAIRSQACRKGGEKERTTAAQWRKYLENEGTIHKKKGLSSKGRTIQLLSNRMTKVSGVIGSGAMGTAFERKSF